MTERLGSGLHGVLWNGFSAVGLILSKVIRGAMIPKLLDPGSYGLFTSVGLFTRYLQFSDLGASAFFVKALPHCHFNETPEAERELAARTYTLILLSGIPVALWLGLCALQQRGEHQDFYRTALLLLIPATLAARLREFLTSHALGTQNYKGAALASTINNYASMALTVGGVMAYGALGGVLGMCLSEGLVLWTVRRRLGFPVRVAIGPGLLARWRASARLLMLSLSEVLASTVDQIFILQVFDTRTLGLYGLGLTFGWVPESLSEVFNNTFYPRLTALAKTHREEALALLHRTLACYLIAGLALLPVLVWLIEVAVGHYFTRYSDGLAVYPLMVFLGLARGAMSLVRRAFVALDLEGAYIAFTLAMVGLCGGALGFAWRLQMGFESSVGVILVVNALGFVAFYARLGGERSAFRKNLALMGTALGMLAAYQFAIRSTPGAVLRLTPASAYLAGTALLAFAWACAQRREIRDFLDAA